jgi:long-subunit acyl-CoA synthetase (AMP-forming)
VKLAPDGEILVRSEMMFSGYYKAPEETAAAFSDGWLLTGDLGTFDEDGFLKITGRKKELIVTSTGKKISPLLIENMLKEHHAISQAMVCGEGKSYLVALITVNGDAGGLKRTVQKRWMKLIVACRPPSRSGSLPFSTMTLKSRRTKSRRRAK